MNAELTKRMRKALEALEYECDYEDGRMEDQETFILPGKLGVGIGEKTLKDLLAIGLITKGTNRWHNVVGYRITSEGRAALK